MKTSIVVFALCLFYGAHATIFTENDAEDTFAEYSGNEPECSLDSLNKVYNGWFDLMESGTVAKLVCNDGFKVWGREELTCGQDGEWENPHRIGRCIAEWRWTRRYNRFKMKRQIYCHHIDLHNLQDEFRGWWKNRCSDACTNLPPVEGGAYMLLPGGNEAELVCREGFMASTSSKIACKRIDEEWNWEGAVGECISRTPCTLDDLSDENGYYTEETNAVLNCHSGYHASCDAALKCTPGGWEGRADLQCVLDPCTDDPPTVQNGNYVTNDNYTAILECDPGYENDVNNNGDNQYDVLKCVEEDGATRWEDWDDVSPMCEQKECERFPDLANGEFEVLDNYIARQVCDQGYSYFPPDLGNLSCIIVDENDEVDVEWREQDGSLPYRSCNPYCTESPPSVDEGSFQVSRDNSYATLECNSGYEPSDDQSTTLACQVIEGVASWVELEVSCRQKPCESTPRIIDGSWNTNVNGLVEGFNITLNCDSGYKPVQEETLIRQCIISGGVPTWNGSDTDWVCIEEPVAAPQLCVDPSDSNDPTLEDYVLDVANERSVGATASLSCKNGVASVPEPITCSAVGSGVDWTGTKGVCLTSGGF